MADFRSARSHGRWDSHTWSLTLGSLFGIRVRVHLLLFFVAGYFIVRGLGDVGVTLTLQYIVPMQAFLWLTILLHEFGHCFGCRSVGGTADDVLLWPLGGLAFCEPPKQPIPSLMTTLSGPAVNLAFVLLLFPIIAFLGGSLGPLFNPVGSPFSVFAIERSPYAIYLALFFKVNYVLLLFNMLLPIFPFDLGRTIQELLWMRIGYYASMVIATNIGIVASIVLVGVGLYLAGAFSADYFFLSGVAIFGFVQCVNMRRELEMNAALMDNEFGYDFSEGYTSLDRQTGGDDEPRLKRSLSPMAIFRGWRERRQAAYSAKAEQELDRILDKIHAQGMGSLSRSERKLLETASNRRRRKS